MSAPMDPAHEELFLGIAYALFMNRLHVLRLTEVVRLGIRPNAEDGVMEVPPKLDRDLQDQAIAYVLKSFPDSWGPTIQAAAKSRWLGLD
ncbi:MAG: hypothetical protein H6709_22495 [Kofleriaceae bacterium]|nr:hypothetical protein [Kofleriaceae bacterium]